MQAPTTPSGPPVKEPGERTCPNCGAANGLTAAFCWQCYQPFGAYRQPPGLAGSPPDRGPWTSGMPAPPAWTRPTFEAPARRRGGAGRILAVVLLTLALIGGATWWMTRNGSIALPESFAGVARIDDTQTAFVVDTFQRRLESMGVEGDIGLYGAGLPTTALVWLRGAEAPTTEAAFDEFATGFDSGSGASGSLDASRKTVETVDGVIFVCAPLSSEVSGAICMWQDRDVFWLLFDFSGGSFEAARGLAQGAHEAVSTG